MSYKSFLVVASMAISVAIGWILAEGNGGRQPSATDGPTPVKIGVSFDTLKEARWTSDRDAFVARAEDLGAEVTVLSANSDDNRQLVDIESLITAKVDVMVIVPHDGAAMAKGVRLAHEASIPVIAYDRLVKDSPLDLYVTFDNRRVGRLQAEHVLDRFAGRDEPARVVRIFGSKTDNNASQFKAGQDDVLRPAIAAGRVEVLHEDWAQDWKPENAKRIMNAALTKYGPAIDAVIASNDGTAGGAIQALKEEGVAGEVLVTGQDAELVACQRIARGEQAMTVYKPVQRLARDAAELAVRMARGRPVVARGETNNGEIEVPTVLLDVVTVTRQNLASTVIADGFQQYDEVYQGIAEAERPPRLNH